MVFQTVKKLVLSPAQIKKTDELSQEKELSQETKFSVSETNNNNDKMKDSSRHVLDKELPWDKTKILMSKTDKNGTIEFANDCFIEVSGYDDYELIGNPHNIIRHPDMPKVIFKVLWDSLKGGENFYAVIKNLTKTGYYYWVITTFEIIRNERGEITNYIGYRKAVPKELVDNVIAPLYKRLLSIEQASGMELSEKYLIGFLEQEKKTYVEYITDLMLKYSDNKENKKDNKGFFSRFFGK